jgi:short-subunit dehydrogenase
MNSNKNAIITGSTSGIGAAFAREFAAKGYDLILAGRREAKIRGFASELEKSFGVHTSVSIVELSDMKQVEILARRIEAIPNISAFVNNAGFGGSGGFVENPAGNRQMLTVHVVAAMRITEAVIPRMIAAGGGAIINVSSVAAFFPLPGSATYAATKQYLITFSEALQLELEGRGIHVQALCPGMTRTDFHEKMGEDGERIQRRYIFGWMEPERVARLSLRQLGKKQVLYVPGLINKFLVRIVSKIPRPLYRGLIRIAFRDKKGRQYGGLD